MMLSSKSQTPQKDDFGSSSRCLCGELAVRRSIVIAGNPSSPVVRQLVRLFTGVLGEIAGEATSEAVGSKTSVRVIEQAEKLVAALARGSVGILVVPLDYSCAGLDAIGLVKSAVPSGEGVQVIYTAAGDAPSSRVYLTDHAYLLPKAAEPKDVRMALACAIERLRRWGERPFLLHAKGGEKVILPRKVSYVESDRRIVCIHEPDEVIEAYGKLSDVKRLLSDQFVQCHKSFLVNMGLIVEIDGEGILLTTGDRIPVSQRRRAQTRARSCEFVGRSLQRDGGGRA